jgi:TonB family protein
VNRLPSFAAAAVLKQQEIPDGVAPSTFDCSASLVEKDAGQRSPFGRQNNLKGSAWTWCYDCRTIYTMKTFSALLVCSGLFYTSVAFAQFGSGIPDWQSLKIIQTVEPIFPTTLTQKAVTTGEARVAINTDADGKLTDWLVVGYSRRELADAFVVALKEWKFEPARLRGVAVGTTIEIFVYFEAKGVVVSTTAIDQLEGYLGFAEGRFAYRPRSLRELDRIPTPLVVVKPLYTEELAKKGVRGRVTVDFYITEDGTVRLPSVSPYDDSQLTALAIDALRQWKFEPPTHNGNPTLVKATQVFSFNPAK